MKDKNICYEQGILRVRSREIDRMEWKDIHLEDKELIVPHPKTKTGEP